MGLTNRNEALEYLQAQRLRCYIEMLGMLAENDRCKYEEKPPQFRKADFDKLQEEYSGSLSHNGFIATLDRSG